MERQSDFEIYLYFRDQKKLLKTLHSQQNQAMWTILKVNRRTNVDTQRQKMRIHTLLNECKINMLCLAYTHSHRNEYIEI